MNNHGINVLDMGAEGDGVTDDTEAVQLAINTVYERGGGTVYFPFTPDGYRIAKPAQETVDGKPCRSQLYIPCETSDHLKWRNICLEGEMPVRQIYFKIDSIDIEPGAREPEAYRLEYGVYDPDNRMTAHICYHIPEWARNDGTEPDFPVCGGDDLTIKVFK